MKFKLSNLSFSFVAASFDSTNGLHSNKFGCPACRSFGQSCSFGERNQFECNNCFLIHVAKETTPTPSVSQSDKWTCRFSHMIFNTQLTRCFSLRTTYPWSIPVLAKHGFIRQVRVSSLYCCPMWKLRQRCRRGRDCLTLLGRVGHKNKPGTNLLFYSGNGVSAFYRWNRLKWVTGRAVETQRLYFSYKPFWH